MGGDWTEGLFGCIKHPKVCIFTCCIPCYVVGKNSETLGEDCVMHGVASMCIPIHPILRYRIRQEKGIEGTMIMDGVLHMFLPWCALGQEAVECGWASGDVSPGGDGNIGRN
ncbi:hypothetical protein A3Q56_05502 [Intoshia linei]|uniref:Uncharacterized protein n=1 Tax=Intoshia linei TaxID=1819745 RepID=A0A177AZ23_9BILA|nr:hypothetical protein A3Q56_05502 [Intoshia linei]